MSSEQAVPTQGFHADARDGGHLYMQTNEIRNAIIHYLRSASGTITEVERIPTRAAPAPGFSGPSTRPTGRTLSRARGASSSRRIDGFCLLPMAATIRSPASG